ncbi:MAG: hypothetical protein Kow00109_30450 [Acidobacteriota bacterium]
MDTGLDILYILASQMLQESTPFSEPAGTPARRKWLTGFGVRRLGGSLLPLVAAGWLFSGVPAPQEEPPAGPSSEWWWRGGSPEFLNYSPLRQINRSNVHRLQVAWTYDTGDAYPGSEMQTNPLVVHGVLYGQSPKLRVFALDAATGEELWTYDPFGGNAPGGKLRSRGLAYWEEGDQRRLFFTAGPFLYALDAATGRLAAEFGRNGRVDLREDLGRDASALSVSATSPGIVYRDLLIMGSTVAESLPAAPGHIRAYDVRTGRLRWIFHTIPQPGEFGYHTWPEDGYRYLGGANCWAGMSLDPRRGIVYIPTGSAAFDFYGGNRHGDNLFANCLLALDAATGQRLWHLQVVKHDVWDRDLPAPPSLVTIRRNGRIVDAVAQITKSGHVLLLDRETGESLFPLEYRPVPASEVPGERLAPTQLFPLWPPPFARQRLSEEQVTDRTPEARAAVLAQLRKLDNRGPFTPPSFQGTVIFPGFDGGGEWGGGAFDPETGMFYVNSNEMAWILRLVERPRRERRLPASALYLDSCAACHLEDRSGNPPEFPDLRNLNAKFTRDAVRRVIAEGAPRMPAFAELGSDAVDGITDFLMTGADRQVTLPEEPAPDELPFTHDGYNKFLDPDGYPAVAPPWGTLNAYDLNTGELIWKIPFGEYPELAAQGRPQTGSENYGGGVVTAGGLLFIGATIPDKKFRAFDKRTGALLWETELPAGGNATPAVYEAGGRQFVVIAAGGGKWGAPSAGIYVAFALPE